MAQGEVLSLHSALHNLIPGEVLYLSRGGESARFLRFISATGGVLTFDQVASSGHSTQFSASQSVFMEMFSGFTGRSFGTIQDSEWKEFVRYIDLAAGLLPDQLMRFYVLWSFMFHDQDIASLRLAKQNRHQEA